MVDNSIVENSWNVPSRIANGAQIRDKFTYDPNNFQTANGSLTISATVISTTNGATGHPIIIEQLSVNSPGGNASSGPSILDASAPIPNGDDFSIYFDIYADARGASYIGASTIVRFTITNGITTITRDYEIAQD